MRHDSGPSRMVGLVVPDIRNPFFPEVATGFQDGAHLRAMEAIVMNVRYDLQRTREMVGRLLGLRVAGVAFLTSQIELPFKTDFAQREIPAVYLDHGEPDRYISTIAIGYHDGILEAVEHIRRFGHRRVGFIGGVAHLDSSQRRKQAFLEGASRPDRLEVKAIDSDFTVQGGYFACAQLLKGFAPTAIMAANDLMAIGAMHCVHDRGFRVPADVSIVGFDDITFAQFTQPALTTVSVPRAEIGRLAFEALWGLITDPDRSGRRYEVKPLLVTRQSTAALGDGR